MFLFPLNDKNVSSQNPKVLYILDVASPENMRIGHKYFLVDKAQSHIQEVTPSNVHFYCDSELSV